MHRTKIVPWLIGAGLLAALVATLPKPEKSRATRDSVVRIALAEKGKRDPLPYWSDVSESEQHPHESWCGAFVLWVLRTAGITNWTYDAGGAWFYRLPRTLNPKPGDLIFFPETRHLAMITSADARTLGVVDGAGTDDRVSTRTVTRPVNASVEMFSIDPLLDGTLPNIHPI